MHLPRINESTNSQSLHLTSYKGQYTDCLEKLVKAFSVILDFVDKHSSTTARLRVGNQQYQISLVQQRNAELLVVALLNLRISSYSDEQAFFTLGRAVEKVLNLCSVIPLQFIDIVVQTLQLKTVNQPKLKMNPDTNHYCGLIAESFAKYKVKNPLVIIRRGSSNQFRGIAQTVNMTMDQALALHTRLPHARLIPSKHKDNSPKIDGQPTPLETEAAQKLKRWWRVRHSLQKALTTTFNAGPVLRLKALMAVCPAGILRSALRWFFISRMRSLTEP